jgi:hypothetical protein
MLVNIGDVVAGVLVNAIALADRALPWEARPARPRRPGC